MPLCGYAKFLFIYSGKYVTNNPLNIIYISVNGYNTDMKLHVRFIKSYDKKTPGIRMKIKNSNRNKKKVKKQKNVTVRRSATIEAPAATLICVVSTLELMT